MLTERIGAGAPRLLQVRPKSAPTWHRLEGESGLPPRLEGVNFINGVIITATRLQHVP